MPVTGEESGVGTDGGGGGGAGGGGGGRGGDGGGGGGWLLAGDPSAPFTTGDKPVRLGGVVHRRHTKVKTG